MKTFRKTIIFPLVLFFFTVGIATAVGMFLSVNTAAEKPKLYSRDNVLAAGNYNDGTSSSDITLIIQVEVDGNLVAPRRVFR